jgi:hypothetical protein
MFPLRRLRVDDADWCGDIHEPHHQPLRARGRLTWSRHFVRIDHQIGIASLAPELIPRENRSTHVAGEWMVVLLWYRGRLS